MQQHYSPPQPSSQLDHVVFLGAFTSDMPARCKVVQWQSLRACLGCGYCVFQASNIEDAHTYRGYNEAVPQTIMQAANSLATADDLTLSHE